MNVAEARFFLLVLNFWRLCFGTLYFNAHQGQKKWDKCYEIRPSHRIKTRPRNGWLPGLKGPRFPVQLSIVIPLNAIVRIAGYS
jgi:hypothetical protein